jgi:hypothetical protein
LERVIALHRKEISCFAPFRIIAGHDTTAGFFELFSVQRQPYFNAYISLVQNWRLIWKTASGATSNSNNLFFYYQSNGDGDVKTANIYQEIRH